MISSLAHIHSKARIGNNVTIDPFAVIEDGVTIGDDSHIMSHVTIFKGTTIGKSSRIFPCASIGAIPQDLKFVGEETTVEIGDHTTIREYVTINRGTKESWKTIVGNNTLIMAYSHIAHDCIIGNNVILANCVQLAGHIVVGDWATLAGMCAVHQFVHIGKHSFIGGGSVFGKDVPPFIKAGRKPLSYAGVNSIGLQRRGFSQEKINNILEIYRHIYTKGLNISQSLEIIENKFSSCDEKDEIVNFIKGSKRGIIKASAKETTDED